MTRGARGAHALRGASDQETILCPPGTQVNAAGEEIWCEGPGGVRSAPSYAPVSEAPSRMGVIGWGVAIAGGLLGAAWYYSRKKGRR